MQYLICASHADAIAISARVAQEQGCTGDVTAYWFGVQDHPTDGRAAVLVLADEEDKLSPDERAELVLVLPEDWAN